MLILALDTETNDRSKDWNGDPHNVDNWPRLVQLGFLLGTSKGKILRRYESLVQPGSWSISEEASKVHGYSTDDCSDCGVDVFCCLSDLLDAAERADVVVAHNMHFDQAVLTCESLRMASSAHEKIFANTACTMHLGTDVCGIAGTHGGGNKWPRLHELHEHLLGRKFDGAHTALADAEACYRCYVELLKLEHNLV